MLGLASNEIKASGNRYMLPQVLNNLLNNALDAMQEAEKKELVIKIYSWKVKEAGYKTGYRRAYYFKSYETGYKKKVLVVDEEEDFCFLVPENLLNSVRFDTFIDSG